MRRAPRTVTPLAKALSDLRDVVEFEHLDVYTRIAPGRNSVFVIRVTPEGSRRTEVFYDEETQTYRAMPRFSTFGAVKSRDLGKVSDFLRDELCG